jgi:hypothetical protein
LYRIARENKDKEWKYASSGVRSARLEWGRRKL